MSTEFVAHVCKHLHANANGEYGNPLLDDTEYWFRKTRFRKCFHTACKSSYSGDDEQFTLRVTTGDAVNLALQEGLPRTPIGFSLESPSFQMGDVTVWTGAVQEGLTAEVDPVELEFHGLSGEAENTTSVAVMRLDEQYSNITLDDGTWWEFSWSDYIADGYVSGGDLYQIRTNSTGEQSVAVYDLWAESWTDGPLQGS